MGKKKLYLLIALLFTILFACPAQAAEWIVMDKGTGITPSKVSTILFNQSVDMSTINSTSVYVTGAADNTIEITITPSADGKSNAVDEKAVTVFKDSYGTDIIRYNLWKKPESEPEAIAENLIDLTVLSYEAINAGVDKRPEVMQKIKTAKEHFYTEYILARGNPGLSYKDFKSVKASNIDNLLSEALSQKDIKIIDVEYSKLSALQKEDPEEAKIVVAKADGSPVYLEEVLDNFSNFARAQFLAAPDKTYFINRTVQQSYIKSRFDKLSAGDSAFVQDVLNSITRSCIAEAYYNLYLTGRLSGIPLPDVTESQLKEYYRSHPELFQSDGELMPFETVRGLVEKTLINEEMQASCKNYLSNLKAKKGIEISEKAIQGISGENFWAQRGDK